MADRGWKQAERAHASDLGVRRIPVTGERHGADFLDGVAAYQLKVRRAFPVWLFAWLAGIVATASVTGRVGVLVLNRPHSPRRDALVCLRWSDWVALHGTPTLAPGAEFPSVDLGDAS